MSNGCYFSFWQSLDVSHLLRAPPWLFSPPGPALRNNTDNPSQSPRHFKKALCYSLLQATSLMNPVCPVSSRSPCLLMLWVGYLLCYLALWSYLRIGEHVKNSYTLNRIISTSSLFLHPQNRFSLMFPTLWQLQSASGACLFQCQSLCCRP